MLSLFITMTSLYAKGCIWQQLDTQFSAGHISQVTCGCKRQLIPVQGAAEMQKGNIRGFIDVQITSVSPFKVNMMCASCSMSWYLELHMLACFHAQGMSQEFIEFTTNSALDLM